MGALGAAAAAPATVAGAGAPGVEVDGAPEGKPGLGGDVAGGEAWAADGTVEVGGAAEVGADAAVDAPAARVLAGGALAGACPDEGAPPGAAGEAGPCVPDAAPAAVADAPGAPAVSGAALGCAVGAPGGTPAPPAGTDGPAGADGPGGTGVPAGAGVPAGWALVPADGAPGASATAVAAAAAAAATCAGEGVAGGGAGCPVAVAGRAFSGVVRGTCRTGGAPAWAGRPSRAAASALTRCSCSAERSGARPAHSRRRLSSRACVKTSSERTAMPTSAANAAIAPIFVKELDSDSASGKTAVMNPGSVRAAQASRAGRGADRAR
ncbi:MAG TPA: hypothetical protein VGI24_09570 [Solirubrobacteraceae bacterium]|jgi:hypothetical protein